MAATDCDLLTVVEYLLNDDIDDAFKLYCAMSTVQLCVLTNLRRDFVPRVTNFAENVVPQYTLDDFKGDFRIGRRVFERILQSVGPFLQKDYVGGNVPITPEKMLLVFSWFLANMGCMRTLSCTFNLSMSTVHDIIYRVLDVIKERLYQVIRWPDQQKQRTLARETALLHGLPGCVGFIDGTHIRLPFCPRGDQDYINRKKYPSVVLQVVVDQHMVITDVYVGWPGSTHDARVLRNSPLFSEAEAGQRFVDNHFIIGDSAYPLKDWLVTAFRDNGHLNGIERHFNRVMTSLRQVVERSIGHVKGRFRKLREVHLYNMEGVCKIVFAGCVFHNLCVLEEDDVEDYIEYGMNVDPNNYPPPGIVADDSATNRRNVLAQNLM